MLQVSSWLQLKRQRPMCSSSQTTGQAHPSCFQICPLLEFLSLWLNLSRWLPLFIDQGGRTRLCTGTTGNHNRCSLLSGSCWNQNPPHIPQTWRDAWACWLPNPHTPPTRLENLRMLGLQEPFYHNFNGWAHTLNMLICPSGAPEMPSCVEQIIVEKSGSF